MALDSFRLYFRDELINVIPFKEGAFKVQFLDGTSRMIDCEPDANQRVQWFFFNRQDDELAKEVGYLISEYIDQYRS
jgi:hypothetical protein